jgi:hypothetical protein
MARSLLTESQLPKSYWYWAVREVARRLNLCPLTKADKVVTTPFTLFYGVKPDYCTLFSFGAIGYYRYDSPTFESESRPGIALGRSDYTNGLIFYSPANHTFTVSADYTMDAKRSIRTLFPCVVYDEGYDTTSLYSKQAREEEPYPPDTNVFAYLEEEGITVTGIVTACPTRSKPQYSVRLEDNTILKVAEEAIWSTDDDVNMNATYDPSCPGDDPLTPSWIVEGCGVTLYTDEGYKRGTLKKDDADDDWLLEVCKADVAGEDPTCYPIQDLSRSWRTRMMERTLLSGWPADPSTADMHLWLKLSATHADDLSRELTDGLAPADRTHHARTVKHRRVTFTPDASVEGVARIVSAKGLKNRIAPRNLREALSIHNPDRPIWIEAYQEEYEGLQRLNTFTIIDETQLQQYVKRGCEVVPSMSIFTVKPDEKGEPYRAKGRTVVLGNLEKRTWSKADRYAPVLSAIGARLLASLAVGKGRILKQGDCKNAFCQPELPEDEIVIVIPPKGCPYTKPGTYWKLNKTLYGLSRS